jgi:hypothetical protein
MLLLCPILATIVVTCCHWLLKCQFIFYKYRERGITLTDSKIIQGVRNDGIPELAVTTLAKYGCRYVHVRIYLEEVSEGTPRVSNHGE